MTRIIILTLIFIKFITNIHFANAETFEADLYIKDHKFEPQILNLPSNQKIRLTVHNQDDTIEEFESTDLKREKIILGKSKAKVILAPLKPGEYKFFGEFHEETAQGKIVVSDDISKDKKD